MSEWRGQQSRQENYKPSRPRPNPQGFTAPARERFHKLLTLAAESPFVGERRNALAAARRLARRYGLTLEEAAAGGTPAPEPPRAQPPKTKNASARFTHFWHHSEAWHKSEKERYEAAVAEARARGLRDEAEPKRPKRPAAAWRRKPSRRDPISHATALLTETTIPFAEIAAITGLDIYQVVGLKLKLRRAA